MVCGIDDSGDRIIIVDVAIIAALKGPSRDVE